MQGVELLTDSGVLELAKGTLGLHLVSLKQCVQLSDEATLALARTLAPEPEPEPSSTLFSKTTLP